MQEFPHPFLDRTAELKRLQQMVQQSKSMLLHGAAGIGKSALLRQLRRQGGGSRKLLFTSGNLTRSPWVRGVVAALASDPAQAGRLARRFRLRAGAGASELEMAIDNASGLVLRTLLAEALTREPFVLVLDPLGFMSRQLFELLRELEQMVRVPLVLASRSPHMEVMGNATRFYWPADQRLALGPLRQAETSALFESRIASWQRLPTNLEEFRQHVLEYANGNPGILLRLLDLARGDGYWSGDVVKSHVLTVDFACLPVGAGAPHAGAGFGSASRGTGGSKT